MKNLKKILSLVLTVLMVIGAMPITDVFALDGTPESYLTYTVENGEVTITGCNSSVSGDFVIPDTIEGYPVTSIARSAFDDCESITDITIPDTVKSISSGAFSDTALYKNSEKRENGVLYIGNYLIEADETLTGEYKIKDGTVLIADNAFDRAVNMTSVSIPKSVKYIGGLAFLITGGLFTGNVEDDVFIKTIADGKMKLAAITVDSENESFCSLDGVLYNKDKTVIISYPAQKTGETYTLPDSVTTVAWAAFGAAQNVKEVKLNSGLKAIEGMSFAYSSIETVTMPESLETIGDDAFAGCIKLKEVKFNKGLKSIGETAFMAAGLETLTVPKDVEIGEGAFYYLTHLKTLTFEEGITEFFPELFVGVHADTVNIPKSMVAVSEELFDSDDDEDEEDGEGGVDHILYAGYTFLYGSIKEFNVDEENPVLCSVDGVVYTKDMKNLVMFPQAKECDMFQIPETVEAIGFSAYSENVKSVYFPKEVSMTGGTFGIYYKIKQINSLDFLVDESDFFIYGCTKDLTVYGPSGGAIEEFYSDEDWQNEYGWKFIAADSHSETNHFFNDWKVTKDPTCTEKGSKTRTCYICDAVETAEIEMLDHDYIYTVTPSTCTQEGSVKVVCRACGYADEDASYVKLPTTHIDSDGNGLCDECGEAVDVIASGTLGDNITWSLDGAGKLTLDGEGDMPDFYGEDALEQPWQDYIKQIKKVVVNKGITSISNAAFMNHMALESIELPGGITRIGVGAFIMCFSLADIELPDSVTEIGELAFSLCSSLEKINIPMNVTKIDNEVFELCYKLTEITVDEYNTAFSSEDGVLFNKGKTKLIAYPTAKADKTYEVPDTVTDIEAWSFYECSLLKEITFPDGLKTIGRSAFDDCCGITKIVLPDGLTTIGIGAFIGTNIESISVPPTVTKIGFMAFISTEDFVNGGRKEITVYGYKGTAAEDYVTKPISEEDFRELNDGDEDAEYEEIYNPYAKFVDNCTVGEHYYDDDGNCQFCDHSELMIKAGETKTVTTTGKEKTYLLCIPKTSGTYTFVSNSKNEINGYLYDANKELIKKAYYGSGPDSNCSITYELEAGTTYYWAVECNYVWEEEESFEVTLTLDSEETTCKHTNTRTDAGTAATCTQDGYTAGVYCNDCEQWISGHEIVTSLGHDWNDWTVVTEPDCTTAGLKKRVCKNNADHVETESIPATDHDWEHIIVPSTCSVAGVEYDICLNCDATQNYTVLSLASHDWGEWTTVDEPDCTTAGLKKRVCKNNADHVETESIPATDHDWEHILVPSTCSVAGVEYDICLNCDATQNYTVLSLDSNNHVGDTYVGNQKDPTCVEDGYTGDICCSSCNGVITAGEPITKLGHDYGEWVDDENGQTHSKTCQNENCNDTVTEHKITASHDMKEVERLEPTCLDEGYIKYACSECDYTYTDVIDALGHDWNDGVITTPSTCKVNGVKTYTCKNNVSHTYTEPLPLDSNNHVGMTYTLKQSEPTCEDDGYTGDVHCADCGAVIEQGTVIPALGHDWGDWHTDTEPTCTDDGVEKRVCKNNANHVEERSIDALGHDWNDGVITTPSTCKVNGVKTYTCKRNSNHTYTQSLPLDSNNHVGDTYLKGKKAPTCTDSGYTGDTYCADCNGLIKKGEDIAPLGHKYGDWIVTKEPTVFETGEKMRVCLTCNRAETQPIDKLPSSEAKDNDSGISVIYPDGSYSDEVEITVSEIFDGESFNVLNKEKGNCLSALFDITTLVNGEKAQPESPVWVKIPLPANYNPEKTVVYYVTNTGTLEKMNSFVEDGYIYFEATHFSCYAIVDETPIQTSNPSENCDCICHKSGFSGFIYKLLRFFWKLFKINKTCDCGAVHY